MLDDKFDDELIRKISDLLVECEAFDLKGINAMTLLIGQIAVGVHRYHGNAFAGEVIKAVQDGLEECLKEMPQMLKKATN